MAHLKFAYVVPENPLGLKFSESRGEPLRRAMLRAKREAIQRDCAARRRKILMQSMPKAERERLRNVAREVKYAELLRNDDVEYQAGLPAILAAASAVGTAISVSRLSNNMNARIDGMAGKVEDLAP
jgi:hypothetical protein